MSLKLWIGGRRIAAIQAGEFDMRFRLAGMTDQNATRRFFGIRDDRGWDAFLARQPFRRNSQIVCSGRRFPDDRSASVVGFHDFAGLGLDCLRYVEGAACFTDSSGNGASLGIRWLHRSRNLVADRLP